MLFPIIKQDVGRGAAMLISVMMYEHEGYDRATARLLELTGSLTVLGNARGSWTRLHTLTRELVDDLTDHIHLENEILFLHVLAS